MGADIHLVVEFDHTGPEFLRPTGLAYMEWPRCTDFFVALGVNGKSAQVPIRGFPSPCSNLAGREYGLLVAPDGMLHEFGYERAIEEKEALAQVESGKSHYINQAYGGLDAISDPAYSFPNWITLKELEAVCHSYSPEEPHLMRSPEFNATILLLQYMQTQNTPSRTVYWFDV